MLTLFTFGYWGWGNATPQLRQAVDAVEAQRGFLPPIFVDLRWHRSVRAKGFHGDALRDVVGADRYLWMKPLGNRKIVGRQGDEIEIADPDAIDGLLDLAAEQAVRRRRLIAFCACPLPISEGRIACHRRTVAELAVGAAAERGQALEVVEWPGAPLNLTAPPPRLEVSSALLRQAARGRQTIPIDEAQALSQFAGHPWGGAVILAAPGEERAIVARPAIYSRGWLLPNLLTPTQSDVASVRQAGADYRAACGFAPLASS